MLAPPSLLTQNGLEIGAGQMTNRGSSKGSKYGIHWDDELLTTREAAALTKMSAAWYERKRWFGKGPPYRKIGRSVRYVRSELLAWWIEREVHGDRPV